MQRLVLVWMAILLLMPAPVSAAELFPGKKGAELRKLLRQNYTPNEYLSYRACRVVLFGTVDNNDGKVELAYTTELFAIDPDHPIPDHTVVNTEHTWPQSRYGSIEGAGMKTDLHHLFPCRSDANSDRDNKPFAEIPDEQTKRWWNGESSQANIPAADKRAGFSEATNSQFEPEEDHKGNVARAMVYFFTIYENKSTLDKAWFYPQIATLKTWHTADPADAREKNRQQRIEIVQGNVNPFVLDPTLLERALEGVGPAVPQSAEGTPPVARAGPTSPVGETDSVVGVSIIALLPNPLGVDEGKESATLANPTETEADLTGWKLVDQEGREFALAGKIPAGQTLSVKLVDTDLILDNEGGRVTLVDKGGKKVQTVSYTKEQARAGAFILFAN